MFTERPSRRDLLKLAAAGVAAGSTSGWFGLLADRAARAASQGVKHKSCILLWMQGGPAQSHTFDLKSGSEYKAIPTTVPGIQISEHLPKIAKQMQNLALLRSMKTGDGNHRTATYLMHTGFRQGSGGGLVHPSLGAMVAAELGQSGFELPNYVAVGNAMGPGYLGPKFAPLAVNDFERGLPDLKAVGGQSEMDSRASLVEELDQAFLSDYGANSTKAHQASMQKALELMHSSKTSAFELSHESAATRDMYGRARFGQGCLLARRLVEVGVPFVEVALGGWDTHQGATQRVKALSEQLDPAMAALVADLKDRGLLDNTLVIWMGEFGRAPKTGSQHYARAWTSVLAGGGVKGGQVVGSTDAAGADVKDRPISSPDFMATVCKTLGIDYTKEYMARGDRPMHKVDTKAKPVTQVF